MINIIRTAIILTIASAALTLSAHSQEARKLSTYTAQAPAHSVVIKQLPGQVADPTAKPEIVTVSIAPSMASAPAAKSNLPTSVQATKTVDASSRHMLQTTVKIAPSVAK